MIPILITILSIIIMISIGYFLKQVNFLSKDAVEPLNKIALYILLPCLIFSTLTTADLSILNKLGILPFIILFSSIITGAISYLILKYFSLDDKNLWSVLIPLIIPNTGFMGYPIILGIYDMEGLLRAIFCDMNSSLSFLIISIIMILKFGGSIKTTIRKIALFPILWAIILGLIFNILNIPLNPVIGNTIDYLSQGTVPVIMLALGLSIDFSALSGHKTLILFISIMKLLLFPFVTLILASKIGLTGLEFDVSIIEAAMPSAMISLLLAFNHDLNYELTSDCIFISTVISLFTLPIVIMLL